MSIVFLGFLVVSDFYAAALLLRLFWIHFLIPVFFGNLLSNLFSCLVWVFFLWFPCLFLAFSINRPTIQPIYLYCVGLSPPASLLIPSHLTQKTYQPAIFLTLCRSFLYTFLTYLLPSPPKDLPFYIIC